MYTVDKLKHARALEQMRKACLEAEPTIKKLDISKQTYTRSDSSKKGRGHQIYQLKDESKPDRPYIAPYRWIISFCDVVFCIIHTHTTRRKVSCCVVVRSLLFCVGVYR